MNTKYISYYFVKTKKITAALKTKLFKLYDNEFTMIQAK